MHKKLLLSSMIALALSGCNTEAWIPNEKPTSPPSIPTPEPTPDPEPVVYASKLTASGKIISGDVVCNGQPLDTTTEFNVEEETHFSCQFDSITLGEFEAPTYSKDKPFNGLFDLASLHTENATKVLQSIDTCDAANEICLDEFDSIDIADIYQKLNDNDAVEAFLNVKEEEATDEVDKAPSSHVDNDLAPVVSGGDNDLNDDFVSITAESTLEYKPSADSQVLSEGILRDANGKPIAGVDYFSANSRGTTDNDGKFDYLWGDEITFGIDTFTFGSVKGNQVDYKLTDVSDNKVVKANIQTLLERYGRYEGNTLNISDNVHNVFSGYPNVINELINLNLPNGGLLDNGMPIPNEFTAQFEQGLTAEIDAALKPAFYIFDNIEMYSTFSDTYVTDALNDIFKGVNTFHVFNDNQAFYSATGYTRAMRALNMSNRAFPVMMPRSDINRRIGFGEPQAWTREGKPHVTVDPARPKFAMPPVPLVTSDTATYGFPFVTNGEIGAGNVVFMGNSLYPSILSCPDNYWANSHRELSVDSDNKLCVTPNVTADDPRSDNGNMQRFFTNLFNWLSPEATTIGTNITTGRMAVANVSHGLAYDFFIADSYGFNNVQSYDYNQFTGITPESVPLLVLQAYEPKVLGDGQTSRFIADLEQPKLSTDDITALIHYLNQGGSIVFMDAIEAVNPEPIGRLADAAGISLGGQNVAVTNQSNCGSSYYCHGPGVKPNVHVETQHDMVVIERFDDLDGDTPLYTVDEDGKVTWAPPSAMVGKELYVPKYEVTTTNNKGEVVTTEQFAQIFVSSERSKQYAIEQLQREFPGTPVCTDDYPYEFNCIEFRPGHQRIQRGNYGRPDFDRYDVDVPSMIKAANLGTAIESMAQHEIYYRTGGTQGTRLSVGDLNQTYDNLSVWLWNDNQYEYDDKVQDELGFETLVNYLNCYTQDVHQGGVDQCPTEMMNKLVEVGMIHGADEGELAGYMNPSYPLNYMEKPLTRLMLGRSFWDYDIKVDTTQYPSRPTSASTSATVDIITTGNKVSFSAGNMQSTGLWAKQHELVTVDGDVNANIVVMLADDLTGKPQHETNLNRPPRMQMSFKHTAGTPTEVIVPYGGLIYVQPHAQLAGNGIATFSFSNVVEAALWQDGNWSIAPDQTQVQIAEIDTGHFVYTTALNNVKAYTPAQIDTFNAAMNRFANAASDFYGRDETSAQGDHRRFTYAELYGFRHRFVNDVQISIGAAHSGYPVMSSSYNNSRNTIPTNAMDDWLLWHEAGHNLAAAPFSATGSTEVTNNILALYMQELEGRNDNPQMDRIRTDIQKAPRWLAENEGHAWSHGDAGMRLVMFGQLKIWAEDHFDINTWYPEEEIPAIYSADQGWNLFKLAHRKARGDAQGDSGKNYCSAAATGLSGGDLMMVCTSYLTGANLGEFFDQWNVGESSSTSALGTVSYSGGISDKGRQVLAEMGLRKPAVSPLSIKALPTANYF
uniref:SslE/AcfD family lipoprotein zinc metalloprotease n=1 Tax=Thaumasiovibrio occultus TaxID=1891184 RepID=UPI000B3615F0|nr:SslE/AcfD family lipoprotein zinc metalloprotease [Thaumasiovibrio occultus]